MSASNNESEQIIEIPLDRVRVDANQPRKVFDEQKLRELASSMAKDGLIEPIIVYRVPNEEFLFEIEEGERRFRAAALLNWQSIRCIVIEKKKE
ncbi:MAG: ParB N-terminal domain-containing protein [Candidatus Bathyarchaeia archaeon]|jgi:ParB family chromosome partitioning protein